MAETFMAAPPLLTMEGITKTFPGVRALEHVDLRVERGEIHALIGKNGAGKSTLIRILGGVYQPDEGRILIGGQEVKLATPQAAIAQGIAIVHQELSLVGLAGLVGAGRTELVRAIFGCDRIDSGAIHIAGINVRKLTPSRMRRLGIGLTPEDRKSQGLVLGSTVCENIVLTVLGRLTRLGLLKSRAEAMLVDRLIKDLQIIASSRHAVVRTLSGGNQQKVVIAKWLARKPRVLILDEPTRGVDVHAKAQILTILDRLATEGVGIIFISSELEEVVAVSHRILTMSRGRIVGEMESHKASMQEIILSATRI